MKKKDRENTNFKNGINMTKTKKRCYLFAFTLKYKKGLDKANTQPKNI